MTHHHPSSCLLVPRAARNGSHGTLESLADAGLLERCGSSQVHDKTRETPLHSALGGGQVEAAAQLLASARTEAELEYALKDQRRLADGLTAIDLIVEQQKVPPDSVHPHCATGCSPTPETSPL